MSDQRIEMGTRNVSFLLADGESLDGVVFLSHYSKQDSGPENVGDLLNREAFIPLKGAGKVVLINVEKIMSAKVGGEEEIEVIDEELGTRYPVTIKMSDGKEVRGDFIVELPKEACRVKDYLNLPDHFFRLRQTDCVLYINRHYILSVMD